jgi:hypothetical protein
MTGLPPHLQERVDPSAPPARPGQYVIYWVRHAMRATENPALDVALSMAEALRVPCFVHFELPEVYRFASDRHHTFMLEGARALQRALKERNVGCVVQVHRPSARTATLLELARHASLVVTEVMPVPQSAKWEDAVAKEAPLWRIDASCLAPVWAFPRLIDAASAFRAAATPLWNTRLSAPWRDVEPRGPTFVPDVPSLDLSTEELPALVAACDVDHGLGPVHHTQGGTVNAVDRWERFLTLGLDRYQRDRHDPLRDATSRISAYLHFGHLSAFRVARDCVAHRTDASAKFLDELLVWRELAWHFCLRHPAPDTVEALPAWARASLHAHERDAREYLPSWETLARAQTGNTLWDACQRSLVVHGELQNHARMSWAKALIPWTRNAREALALMLDLNDRHALDGGDPSSIAGPLWCLGAFDRPFPETKYFGVVRPRSLEEQAKRFKVAEFERRVHRPARGQPLVVGVVGAGVSGAACTRALVDAGHSVTLFEANSELGGRLASSKMGGESFDVGAPYFTVTDERFARFARAWWQERLLAEWKPRWATLGPPKAPARAEPTRAGKPPVKLVATPGMSALVERLVEGLDVRLETKVDGLVRRDERFGLTCNGAPLGEFDAVVVALPAPEAAALVDPLSYGMASQLREVRTASAWTAQLVFEQPLSIDFDAAEVNIGPLAWLARENSKPERGEVERWSLRATSEWSLTHADTPSEAVLAQLLDAFWASTGASPVQPRATQTRLWRNGLVARPLSVDCLLHESGRVVACGDWCLGARVEAAYLSGTAAAGRLNAIAPSVIVEPVAPFRPPSQLRLV